MAAAPGTRLSPFAASGARASILAGLAIFFVDRVHKHVQVDNLCIDPLTAPCVVPFASFVPFNAIGWRGGEVVPVTPFFDYVLVWNTGMSYGLFAGFPTWVLGLVMLVAMAALAWWWLRADSRLIRLGLAFCLGGALSNAVDRLLYGAVADFFHFYWGQWSFYIFNIADVSITAGVVLLFLDAFGVGRRKKATS